MDEIIPYGLNVDDTVTVNSLDDLVVDSRFGYSNHHADLNPQIVFASFLDVSFDVYTDYNRVFSKGNTDPLNFTAFNEQYPAASGLGAGLGLKYNTFTFIIHCISPISAIRVMPPCNLQVSISSGPNDIAQIVGVTSSSGTSDESSSELSFLSNASNFIVLDHIGALSLNEIEIFTPTITSTFSTFPILKTGKTLQYLVSSFGSLDVVRKGGLQNETFSIYTVDTGKSFAFTRISHKYFQNLSLEQCYLQEAELYDHILKNTNAIFPLISSIERNCFKHQKMTQNSLNLINKGDDTRMNDLQCSIVSQLQNGTLLFNGIAAPQNFQIIAGIKYIFHPEPVEINGTSVSEVKLNDGESLVFKKHNTAIGIISAAKRTPAEIYKLPDFFMNEVSLNDVLTDILNVSTSLNSLSSDKTPNVGNTISHAAFIDENGKTLSCEESIFLPGDVRAISVYCSDETVPIQILIDGQLKSEIQVSNKRLSIINIEVPTRAGVHSLTTNNGSNVLFRISEKSIIHAPIHPAYYTSGQLERDVFSSSVVKIVAQLNNFDLIDDTTMIARSNSSLISIEDTTFNSYSCTNALFCRKRAVDLKNSGSMWDNFESRWDLCSEHPWLACLDVQNGCCVIHTQINFTNFTFWWYRTSSDDVTVIQGVCCVLIANNKLVVKDSTNTFECDASEIKLSKWNNIAFTNNSFSINGKMIDTTKTLTNTSRIVPAGTVVGTNPNLNLKVLLIQNASNIVLQDFTTERINESEIILEHIDPISSFDMTIICSDSSFDTLIWQNTNTGSLPRQIFKLSSPTTPVSQITGINLPFSISKIELKFTPCGYIRNICSYSDTIPGVIIKNAFENRDIVIDFQRKSVLSVCTNQEQNAVNSEQYYQTNSKVDGTFRYIVETLPSSFYVTPPSLIMMSTSQSTPYSTTQSLLILFNRKIEVFIRDDSTLFTMSGSDGSTTLLKANFCTLLSSQISIPNSFLNLAPSTTYTIHLARARLFQFDGHVPCLETTISFSTA
uniref:Uncharacterized protein n=1 Tax=viral metagenome TaxID=1070528 RepID=A0A6C0J049_9ZZZZ